MNLERVTIRHLKLSRQSENDQHQLECCTYRIWRIRWYYPCSVKEKSHRLGVFALTLAESMHQLLEFGGSLDLKKHLIVIVRNFDVQMFAWRWCVCLGAVGRVLGVGHLVR